MKDLTKKLAYGLAALVTAGSMGCASLYMKKEVRCYKSKNGDKVLLGRENCSLPENCPDTLGFVELGRKLPNNRDKKCAYVFGYIELWPPKPKRCNTILWKHYLTCDQHWKFEVNEKSMYRDLANMKKGEEMIIINQCVRKQVLARDSVYFWDFDCNGKVDAIYNETTHQKAIRTEKGLEALFNKADKIFGKTKEELGKYFDLKKELADYRGILDNF